MGRHHVHLNARRWAAVRRSVFERDGWRCRACGRPGRFECDHIVPLDRGGDPWNPDNLQTLCRSCHIAKTRGENWREPTPAEAAWRQLVAEMVGEIETPDPDRLSD